jgi:hypothetical protein
MIETQLGYLGGTRKGGLFDYIISSPKATVEILKNIKNKNYQYIVSMENYNFPKLSSDPEFPCHKYLNMHLAHESSRPMEEIESKVQHQINNMILLTGNKYFVWSNVQKNLKDMCNELGYDIKEFYLTENNYVMITSIVKELFDGECIFIVNKNMCDIKTLKNKNVHIIDDYILSDDKYLGPKGYFLPILEKYIIK